MINKFKNLRVVINPQQMADAVAGRRRIEKPVGKAYLGRQNLNVYMATKKDEAQVTQQESIVLNIKV